MKIVATGGLLAILIFVIGVVGYPGSNCTVDSYSTLLEQALEIKENCDLVGRYDCCKAITLAKIIRFQTSVYEITNPCINTDEKTQLMLTRCDMETDGGGWTVILRRRSSQPRTDFNRGWNDYEKGFGDLNHEFWIGLKYLHCLTLRDNVDLIIDLRHTDGNGMTWMYNHFKIAGANDNYRISISGGKGPKDGYDAMAQINGSQFSTRDSDNDRSSSNCAQNYGGGWWHKNCYNIQLTGPHSSGIYWYKGSGSFTSPTSSSYYHHYENVEMKIRPQSCKTDCP